MDKPTAAAQGAGTQGSIFFQGDDAWSEVSLVEGRAYRLRLGGSFRSAWMATLCTGLGDRRLSIQTAHARRGPDASWIAELGLLALPGAVDGLHVPYVDLARAAMNHVPTELRLSASSVTPTAAHGGSLRLQIEADDVLGILGSLLASLATVMLFPVEMHIETRDGRAYDTFWLAGMSGAEPSPRAHEAVRRMLQGWVRPSRT
jgi:hypothetical protein